MQHSTTDIANRKLCKKLETRALTNWLSLGEECGDVLDLLDQGGGRSPLAVADDGSEQVGRLLGSLI